VPVPVVVSVRPATAADAPAIREAFQRAFAAVDAGFRARTAAEWEWLYRPQAGHAAPAVVAVDEAGCVLAHYAALSLRAEFDGVALRCAQAIDSFALRGAPGGLARRGGFGACGAAWAELHFGTGPGRHAFVYGLPVERAWRVGAGLLGYELLHENLVLSAGAARETLRAAPGLEAEELAHFDERPGGYETLRTGRALRLVRDAAYLEWRYVACPSRAYRRARLVRDGRLRGFAVWRDGVYGGRRAGLVCELVTAPDDAPARAALQAWLAECSRAAGLDRLLACVAPAQPEFVADQRLGWRVERLGNPWAARSAWPRWPVRALAGRHEPSLGDTDLV